MLAVAGHPAIPARLSATAPGITFKRAIQMLREYLPGWDENPTLSIAAKILRFRRRIHAAAEAAASVRSDKTDIDDQSLPFTRLLLRAAYLLPFNDRC